MSSSFVEVFLEEVCAFVQSVRYEYFAGKEVIADCCMDLLARASDQSWRCLFCWISNELLSENRVYAEEVWNRLKKLVNGDVRDCTWIEYRTLPRAI